MVQIVRDNTNRSSSIHSRRAQIRAATADEANRSIEAVLSTEQPVAMFDYKRWEAIDEILLASGRTIADHVVLLDAHDRSSVSKVLGHLENIRTADGATDTVCLLLFDADDDDAVKAFNKYRNNHVKDISVGYQVLAYQTLEAGESVTIGDRTFTAGPNRRTRIATRWRVDEGSCVPIGADSKAKVRGEENATMTVQVSPEDIEELIAQREQTPATNLDAGKQTDAEKSGANEREVVMTTTTTPAAETRQSDDELIALGAQRESKRRSDIRAMAEGVRPEAVTAAIDDVNCTLDKARELFLNDMQEQRKAPPAGSDAPNIILSGNRHERDCNVNSLAAAVAMRMGVNIESVGHRMNYDAVTGETTFEKPGFKHKARQAEWERNLERADAFRGIHSVDLCREALRMSKVEAPLERRSRVTRAFSTPTVSTIYTTAMGAVLLANLGEMIDSTLGWTKECEAKSFKAQELHRLEGGRLTRRNRGQEAAHASFADTMESYKVNDYASQLVIDRQDLIDDELGAWSTALDEYARAVLSLRPDIVYAVLAANAALATDSVALFNAASHSNLLTGSALAAATLQSALSALASQRGAGGLNLNLMDAYLITGQTLSFTADQLSNSAEIREAAAANGTLNAIKARGVKTAADSRINVGFTDPVTNTAVAAAATTYYVAAANGAYGMAVGHLAGTNGMPTMRTTPLNSEGKFGLSLDVCHTVGAGVADYRGLVKGIA